MDKRNIQGDPGQPEERAATSVHGEGDDDGSATGRSPSPLATEILASDLLKLMEVVKVAAELYNAIEAFDRSGDPNRWDPLLIAVEKLGDALDALGLDNE